MQQVTEEACRAASAPRRRAVRIHFRPSTERAVEGMFAGIDDQTYMPAPHDQITGLRRSHSLEAIDAAIEIHRRRVRIVQTGEIVDIVDQMRAVLFWIDLGTVLPRIVDNRGTLAPGQGTRIILAARCRA